MKRWLGSVCVLVFCMMLCGCSYFKEVKPEELQLIFDCPGEIQWSDQKISCRILHSASQETEIVVTESGVLDQFTYRQSGEESAVGYQKLEHPVDERSFPAECCFSQIADILNAAQSYVNLQEAGENRFTGTVNGTPFTLTADESGKIVKIEGNGFSAVFFPQTES